MLYLITFAIALGLSLYLTPVIRRGAIRFGVMDQPDGRLKHQKEPVPYLGGVAIYCAFVLTLGITFEFQREVLGLLVGGGIVVILGLFDDLKVLEPKVKLLGQLAAALALVKAGIYIELSFLPPWVAMPLTIFWLVGMANALNLIDVMDGLASGIAAIAGAFFFVVAVINGQVMIAVLTAALVGSTLGFLRYNFNPARIYMGDTGSMFLGFMLGALAMIGRYTDQHRLGALAPIIVLAIPLFDTTLISFARWRQGIPIMRGSPDHFAIRLQRWGLSVRKTALWSYAVAILLGGTGLALMGLPMPYAWGIVAALLVAILLAAFLLLRIDVHGGNAGRSTAEPAPEGPVQTVVEEGRALPES